MVKRWIVMLVLTTLLVVGCVFETYYIRKSFNWLVNSLESLQIELSETKDKIDTEELIAKAHSLHEVWHDKVKGLKCLIWHTGVKDAETGFARICVYIKENNYTEAYAEIASLIDYSAHYLDDFKISPENIF